MQNNRKPSVKPDFIIRKKLEQGINGLPEIQRCLKESGYDFSINETIELVARVRRSH